MKPKTIDQYIKSAPKEAQKKLREMRAAIRSSAPGATEDIKWGMTAFSFKRILVCVAGFKHHIGFYPGPPPVKAFDKSLSKYKTAKGSIQFPLDKPLPVSLIRKITAYRVARSLEKESKWRTKPAK